MIDKRRITVPDVMPLIRYFRSLDENSVGGNLHIYLSDGNYHDDHIKFCLEKCVERGDYLGEAICRLSLRMTTTQRIKLVREF